MGNYFREEKRNVGKIKSRMENSIKMDRAGKDRKSWIGFIWLMSEDS
jgi:hypothetical protein